MISINNLTFEFGARAIYDEADWHIKPGEKIGLIGANGTGKSTLLKLIVGEYTPTSGSISMSKEVKIGYLNQDLLSYHSENSILHVAMEAFERQNQLHDEIEEILQKLETEYNDKLINDLSKKQEEFQALDGYTIQYKAEEILAGLGFSAKDSNRPLAEFSGGWRMRVMLAKILLQEPDLLLLDEPTNHLDLPSIKWLETYLQNFSGAIVIVSHDRFFLDRVILKTVEVKRGKLTPYAGNYSFYVEEKELREEIQRNEFNNQQRYIKQEEALINRFRAKASKAKMAQSRIKALDKMERVNAVEGDGPSVNFRFRFGKASGRTVINLRDVSKSYPNNPILKNANSDIEKGDKIALIGANGKGKSTLLRIIAGTETYQGTVTRGHNVTQTFFAQHQLESLHLENNLLDELRAFAPTYTDTEIRGLLGCFLFAGDDVFKKIRVLSGGEKSRVALAKTLTSDANFLVLDEPTNHLDIQSVNILIQALQQYEGTFIVVSHDRYLLDEVANKIWFIEDEQLKEYPGTYREYEEWQERRKTDTVKTTTASTPKVEQKQEKVVSANTEQDKLSKKLKKDIESIENQLAELEEEKLELEKELSMESIYSDSVKFKAVNQRYEEVQKTIQQNQKLWDEIASQILELE